MTRRYHWLTLDLRVCGSNKTTYRSHFRKCGKPAAWGIDSDPSSELGSAGVLGPVLSGSALVKP